MVCHLCCLAGGDMRLIATQSIDELQMQLQLPVAASSIVTACLRSSLFKRGIAALNMQ